MNNKVLIALIGLSLALALAGIISEFSLRVESRIMVEFGFSFYLLLGTYLLVKNGEFKNTRESKLTRIGISIIIVGTLFKIMHWPMAGPILIVGFLCIPIFYLIYVIRTSQRSLTSWGKFLFLTTFLMGRCFKIMHWSYDDELTIVSLILLGALILEFVRNNKIIKSNKN